MFKAFVLSAFAAAAVNAASWPMITVNSAGDIVLNAPTRANSIQFTATAVTAAPTGSTAGTRTTVTDLGSTTNVDSDVFDLTVPSGLATSGGIKLPTPTTGRTITIFNSASSAAAYELWSSSTSVFIDGTSATQVSIDASAVWVQAIAVSTSRWVLKSSAATATGAKGFVSVNTAATASATTGTLTAAQMLNGRLTATVSGAAITYTTATAASLTAADANSNNGDAFTFTVVNAGTQVTGTDLSLILAAGTGVTVPADGTQLVVPGQTRVYSLYRTSSTAWTLVQQSSFLIYPTTTLTVSTAFTSAVSETRTIHATRFTATPPSGGAGSEGFSINFVNNYFGIRDLALGVTSPGTSIAVAAVAGNAGYQASMICGARAEKTINCLGDSNSAAGSAAVFSVIKA